MKTALLCAIAFVTISSLPFISHHSDALAQEKVIQQAPPVHSGSLPSFKKHERPENSMRRQPARARHS
jgi:hypothetical protein